MKFEYSLSRFLTAASVGIAWPVQSATAQQASTTRLSTTISGLELTGASLDPCISADGRFVAFATNATNLFSNDTDAYWDVVLLDRSTGTIAPVSTLSPATPGDARHPAIAVTGTASGEIAYESTAAEIAADTNGVPDVYVAIGSFSGSGTISRELVSRPTGAGQANGESREPSIALNGRYIVFVSDSDNLAAGDTNQKADVFLRDRLAGTTERVSLDSLRNQADEPSEGPRVSFDGRFVAWNSVATNLVLGDVNGATDVFVRDRQTGFVQRASVASDGSEGNGASSKCSLSADGRFVAFESTAPNLVSGDSNNVSDVFVRDRQLAQTTRVSRLANGDESLVPCTSPALSPDGGFVGFAAHGATGLIPGVAPGNGYVLDRGNGELRCATTSPVAPLGGSAPMLSVGDGGRWVAFASSAALVSADAGNDEDVFVNGFTHARQAPVATTKSGWPLFVESSEPSISDDGRFLALVAPSSAFPGGSTTLSAYQVWVVDLTNNTAQVASRSSGGTLGDGSSRDPRIARGGRYVTFLSPASNLVIGVANGLTNAFLHDTLTATTVLVSVANDSQLAADHSMAAVVSDEGRFVAFESRAANVVAGDNGFDHDIFLRDRVLGTTRRISHSFDGSDTFHDSQSPAISADGRFIAFHSFSPSIVSGDTNNAIDVFVHDTQAVATTRASVAWDGAQLSDASLGPSLSRDGRWMAFTSYAGDVVPTHAIYTGDAFVRDLLTGTNELVSFDATGAAAGFCSYAVMSGDGRHVAFVSSSDAITATDTNGVHDVFLRDRVSGSTRLISSTPNGFAAMSSSFEPAVSGDGARVAFQSASLNVVEPPLAPGLTRVFVHDAVQGGPQAYCPAKRNSLGCAAALSSSGQPSAHQPTAFTVTAVGLLNQRPGLFFYGLASTQTAFQGGTRCVAPPVARTAIQFSGGSTSGDDCTGSIASDFNALIQSGTDVRLQPCSTVHVQCWYRDPGDTSGFGTALSDALRFVIAP